MKYRLPLHNNEYFSSIYIDHEIKAQKIHECFKYGTRKTSHLTNCNMIIYCIKPKLGYSLLNLPNLYYSGGYNNIMHIYIYLFIYY